MPWNSFQRRFAWLRASLVAAAALLLCSPPVRAAEPQLGDFEAQADVGKVDPAGSAEFDKSTRQYLIKSSGENIWKGHDDFHFVYRKISGDLVMTADIAWGDDKPGAAHNAHRKAGLMIRQGLDPDAPYVDVMVHGDGLIALQYRSAKGEVTSDIKSAVKAPAAVRLERHGDTYSVFAAPKVDKAEKAAEFQLVGSIQITLPEAAYTGLAVCSHDPKVTETAVFTGVTLKNDAGKK